MLLFSQMQMKGSIIVGDVINPGYHIAKYDQVNKKEVT